MFSSQNSFAGSFQRYGLVMTLAILLAALSACGKKDDAGDAAAKNDGKERKATKAELAYYDKVKDDVVATINGQDITREYIVTYNGTANVRPNMSSRDIVKASAKDLKPIIDDLAITQAAASEADQLPEAKTTEALQLVQEYKNRFLIQGLFERDVKKRIGETTDKEVREFYKANSKDPEFSQPFHFSIRHAFVSNYVPVETKEGDTLESLAMRISGDAKLTSMILVDNEEKSPRAPNYGSNPGIPQIQPGEFLLVPAGPEVKKQNMAKIQDAERRIKAGEDFAKVAQEVSGDPEKAKVIEDIGLSGKVPLGPLVDAVKKTPVNGISPIFETKHGYNIIQVIKKVEEGARPLEEVKDEVRRKLVTQKQKDVEAQYINELFKMPDLKINYAAFKDPATPESAVVVTLAKQTYTNKEVQLPNIGRPNKNMSDEAVLTTLKSNKKLQTDLLLHKARQLGIDKSGAYLGAVDGFINVYKRQLYLDHLRNEEQKKEISMEEARAYFEKNKDDFALPQAYTFYRLVLPIPPQTSTSTLTTEEITKQTQLKAAELTQNVKTLDDFKRVISENAEDEVSKQRQGLVENMAVSEMHPDLLKEIQSIQPGRMSQPLQVSNSIVVAWLVSVRPPKGASLEDYKDNLQSAVKRVKMNKFNDEMNARWLQKANVAIR